MMMTMATHLLFAFVTKVSNFGDDDGGDDGDAGDSDDDDDGDTFGLVALQPQPRPASWSKRWQLGAQQLALLGKRKYATDIHKKLGKPQQFNVNNDNSLYWFCSC